MRFCQGCGAPLDTQTGDTCEYCGNPIRSKGFRLDMSEGKGTITFQGKDIPVIMVSVEAEVIDDFCGRDKFGLPQWNPKIKHRFVLEEL